MRGRGRLECEEQVQTLHWKLNYVSTFSVQVLFQVRRVQQVHQGRGGGPGHEPLLPVRQTQPRPGSLRLRAVRKCAQKLLQSLQVFIISLN